MSTFKDVTKYLRPIKGRKASDDDLKRSNTLPDPTKYNGKRKATREIKWIPVVIVLPAFNYTIDNIPELVGGLLFQYNFSAPNDFYILQKDTTIAPQGFLTVKWRVGNVVHRYKLTNGISTALRVDGSRMSFATDDYTNQLIKKNCVFEWWLNILGGYSEPIGLLNDFRVVTSGLVIPEAPEQLSSDLHVTQKVLERPDMKFTLGTALPYNNVKQAWLDNP